MLKSRTIAATLLCALLGSTAIAADGAAEFFVFKDGATSAPDIMYMGTPTGWSERVPDKDGLNLGSVKSEVAQINAPGDARKVTWNGGIGQIYFQSKSTRNLEDYADADGALVFDMIVHQPPEDDSVVMRVDCRFPCIGLIEAKGLLTEAPVGQKTTVKIPLSCFAKTGTRFSAVNTPFLIYTTKRLSLSFANVRWVKGAAKDPDARTNCA